MIHIAPALVLAAIGTPPQFTAVELTSYPGAPPGPSHYSALGLGPAGAVAGAALQSGVLWRPTGTLTLPTLGGPLTVAAAMNATTFAAGWSTTAAGEPHAFFYNHSGFADLGTLGGWGSWAYGINNSSEIVGQSDTPTATHAFAWNFGVMSDLGSLPGRPSSAAAAVNNSGHIVGNAWASDTDSRAFVYADHHMTDLGLPSWAGPGDWTAAFDVNDSGTIVGATGDINNPTGDRGFVYSTGHWTNLGLVHGLSTLAAAVNNAGDVVGSSDHGFLYTRGTMYDLATLAIPGVRGTLDSALDINNAGQILAHSLEAGTFTGHYYVLTPVPGPAGVGVVGLGMLALARRRRAKQA